MTRYLRISLAVCCAALSVATPARADWDGDRKAVLETIARISPLEKTNPEKAALAYREFYQQNQGMTPTWAVQILTRMIHLHADPLKQTEVALQLCDWALQRFEKQPERLVVVTEKATIIIGQKHPEEAAALIEKEWENLALSRPEQSGPLLAQYCRAMDQNGKSGEASATLRKLMAANAVLLVDWYQEGGKMGWIYDRVIGDLAARNQLDEALRWAKLRFVTCTPEKGMPETAAEVIRKLWLARDPDDRNWRAFQEAQADPAKPNPLAEVKLPDMDVEALRRQAAEMHWGQAVGRTAGLIAAGDLGGAVLLARDTMVNHNANSAVAMATTILHAADLSMRRVGAYQQFMKTRQGPDPLEQVLKEHPPITK